MTSAYFIVDGVKYYNYNLYSNQEGWQPADQTNFVVNLQLWRKMADLTCDELDFSFRPTQGDKVNMVPPCILPIDDVRKNYAIKRGLDTGTCNVFSPKNQSSYCSVWANYMIVPKVKSVFLVYGYGSLNKTKLLYMFRQQFPNEKGLDVANECIFQENTSVYFYNDYDPFRRLFDGTLTKPCIPYTSLSLNSNLELTLDALYLVYKTGKETEPRNKNIPNFVVEINALNNYNWREYPGTLSLLMNSLLNKPSSTKNDVSGCSSRYSKAVKNLVKVPVSECISEKDFNMAKALINTVMEIGDKKFVKYEDIVTKLVQTNLSMQEFAKYYKTITKIEQNEFKG